MAVRYCNELGAYRIEICRVIDGVRHRKSKTLPRNTTHGEAIAIHDKLEAELFSRQTLVSGKSGWQSYVQGMLLDSKSWVYTVRAGMLDRARIKGVSCTLSTEDVCSLLLRSKGRCEISGLEFRTDTAGGRRRPFFHSIDRIDCSRGYVYDNCRVVCVAINIAMSNWGEGVFESICIGYIMNKYIATGFAPVLSRSVATVQMATHQDRRKTKIIV